MTTQKIILALRLLFEREEGNITNKQFVWRWTFWSSVKLRFIDGFLRSVADGTLFRLQCSQNYR